jgi:hypothetical protein
VAGEAFHAAPQIWKAVNANVTAPAATESATV